jgi:phosphoadenosine phosphosulfate reductase
MATPKDIQKILAENALRSPAEVLTWALQEFGAAHIGLATSFGAEDQVLTDLVQKQDKTIGIFTLDTGRLPQETYNTLSRTREFFGCPIEVLFPDRELVETMVNAKGPNLFYQSIENRKQCCEVRKLVSLRRKLGTLKAWICGLRREQSVTRGTVDKVEWDEAHGLFKLNPLADWTEEQVWQYIKEKGLPYNVLHDAGYPSIGCAPCTRAVQPGADIRSGRWWWENPDQKECGLHGRGQKG